MFQNRYHAATDVGLRRENNEDAYFASAKDGLWVVADGMGGHASGEIASAIVVETICREVKAGRTLQQAIQKSHHDILNSANSGLGGAGMGSTVVAIRNMHQHYEICWVGDSRAYVVSPKLDMPKEFELRQLTTDHSYVQMLYQSGAISADEIDSHPEKNIITQCLGSVELSDVHVDRIVGEWSPNSMLLLCSDGLSDVVSEEEIKNTLVDPSTTLASKSQRLIKAALNGGGKDNVTLALIKSPSAVNIWLQKLKEKFLV